MTFFVVGLSLDLDCAATGAAGVVAAKTRPTKMAVRDRVRDRVRDIETPQRMNAIGGADAELIMCGERPLFGNDSCSRFTRAEGATLTWRC